MRRDSSGILSRRALAPEELEDILIDYMARLRQHLPWRAAILFGSYARGEALPGSDVDLAVVSEAFAGMNRFQRGDMLLALWDYPLPAEIFGFTPEELLGLASPFLWNILEHGRVLHDEGVAAQAREVLAAWKVEGNITPVRGGWRIGF